MAGSNLSRIRFADFEADLATGELWRAGVPVRIQDLPFRLLAVLVERPGDVISRADLNQRVWGAETFVDVDAGVNTAIAKLREALGDSADAPKFIETVPKRGYRFLGRVEIVDTPAPASLQPSAGSPPSAAPTPRRRPFVVAGRAAAAVIVTIGGIVWLTVGFHRTTQTRVAVALFDNETGQPALDRLAQSLTDATVASLTAQPALAVIGNAAVLRTSRPFRDLVAIRDALHADFIVIGQVQTTDGTVQVRTHLIRTTDQSHIWVHATPLTASGEAALETEVAARVSAAVSGATAR